MAIHPIGLLRALRAVGASFLPRGLRRGGARALLGLAAAACAHPTGAVDDPRPPLPGFRACESSRGPAWCGTVEVPEDHDQPASGRTVTLRVKVIDAADESDAAPVFFLAGGPGQAAADVEGLWLARLGARLPERAFVLVDQRGTGGSSPLVCATGALADPGRLFGPHYTDEELSRCLDDLSARTDVTRYTTPDFVADLDVVRERLGAERMVLVGGSYGTKAAQVYMRTHPDRVESAVLEGVASPGFLNPLPAARGSQAALEATFAACAAEEPCLRRFPGLDARFHALMERLAERPEQVETAPGVRAELTRDALAYLVHVLLFQTSTAAVLPALIDQVDRGDHTLLVNLYGQIVQGVVGGIAFGMQLTVTCSENAPFFGLRDVEAETRGSYLGRTMVDGVAEQCEAWPNRLLSPDYLAPVTVPVPALLVAGGLDPATPPRFAAEVASALPRADLVTVPEGAHITAHPCIDGIVASWIRAEGKEPPATDCVAQIRRPPFMIPPP